MNDLNKVSDWGGKVVSSGIARLDEIFGAGVPYVDALHGCPPEAECGVTSLLRDCP